ncbi:hypothetical protein VTN31DRAFT_2619 [Thermomyces dupontii]|uniref:uncharacterized protein n=1 Tax=Talaromyces thermophilus TaxID=28565 RepID=UPI0037444BD9
MCGVIYWESETCNHRWLTIDTPCIVSTSRPGRPAPRRRVSRISSTSASSSTSTSTASSPASDRASYGDEPAHGFNDCPLLMQRRRDGRSYAFYSALQTVARRRTGREHCPQCRFRGVYDRNQIRMVRRVKTEYEYGVRRGADPEPGCCILM